MERIVESYSDDIEINLLDFDANSFVKSVNPIREFIVNAWDADSEKVMITTTSSSLIFEDWGTGIDNFKKFWTIGSQHKSSVKFTPILRRKPIGWRGLGKLSFSKFGSKLLVETRTKQKSESSNANLEHMKFAVKPMINHSNSLSHNGTRITITELKNKIPEKEIIHFICKVDFVNISAIDADRARCRSNGVITNHRSNCSC